ncbi:hypothetical protein CANARDRAFT_173603 [[Candida] arabinofermentans NRRL YB-2248]|uniref:INO80 complex subunit B-like conserved region domain-containing protein n=1 Tax=[Candida] arabinofermentans NRRL YB-2248 TaxID=983967 RepID=A0A1E4T7P2_9ASCO|nr:hypothetical protein CANARDRAFT_173603 [[Candida] arabinofermentans NRRL YB-2248]
MEDQASDAGFGFEDDDEDDEGEVLNNNDLTRMTERQRSRYLDTSEDIELPEDIKPKAKSAELLALSNEPLKKKQFTEEEIQLRKLENARKRKNFNIKRLEMEKRDTLNKLLLKRADKVKNLQALEGQEYLDEDENSASKPNQRQLLKHKALFSWYSKTVTSDDGTRKNVSLYHIP